MWWKRYVLAFLVTALVGLVVRAYSAAVVPELFGWGSYALTSFVPSLILPTLVAAAAASLLPKGFPLWGVAAIFLHPPVGVFSTNNALEAGVIESSELGSLAVAEVVVFAMLALACKVASASGAGLRLLWWRFSGEPLGDMLGMSSGNNRSA